MAPRKLSPQELEFVQNVRIESEEVAQAPKRRTRSTGMQNARKIAGKIFDYRILAAATMSFTLMCIVAFVLLMEHVNQLLGTGVLDLINQLETKSNADAKKKAQDTLSSYQLDWLPLAGKMYAHRLEIIAAMLTAGLVVSFGIIIVHLLSEQHKNKKLQENHK